MRPTREDFQTFIAQRGVARACPCCGSEGYFTGGLTEGEAIAGLIYALSPPEGGMPAEASDYMRPQISMICSNCGYVRLFDYQIVQEWANYFHEVNEPTGGQRGS